MYAVIVMYCHFLLYLGMYCNFLSSVKILCNFLKCIVIVAKITKNAIEYQSSKKAGHGM